MACTSTTRQRLDATPTSPLRTARRRVIGPDDSFGASPVATTVRVSQQLVQQQQQQAQQQQQQAEMAMLKSQNAALLARVQQLEKVLTQVGLKVPPMPANVSRDILHVHVAPTVTAAAAAAAHHGLTSPEHQPARTASRAAPRQLSYGTPTGRAQAQRTAAAGATRGVAAAAAGRRSRADSDVSKSEDSVLDSKDDELLAATFDEDAGFAQEDNDLAIAMRLMEEEMQEDSPVAPAPQAVQDDVLDTDELTYDELLALGDRMGDVRLDRWRQAAPGIIAALPTIVYAGSAPANAGASAEMCLVCQCQYEEEELLKTLPCCHVYHGDCIDQWLQEHRTCPVCTNPVAPSP